MNFLMDITVIAGFFYLATWFAIVNVRFHGISRVFDQSLLIDVLHIFTMAPPIVGSIIFSLIITFIEKILVTKAQKREFGMLTASEDSDTDASKTDEPSVPCLPPKLPLMVTSLFTVLLQVVEAVLELMILVHMHWYRTFVAGLIMKWTLRSLTVTLAENLVRSHCFKGESFVGKWILQWVRANRMFRDLIVSSLILICLTPFVLITWINDECCPGCSWHQLLIYRDTGHRRRLEAPVMPSPASRRKLAIAPDQVDLMA